MTSADVVVSVLRFAIILGLYGFLLAIVVVLVRGLGPRRAPARLPARPASTHARLLVLDPEAHGLPASFDLDGEAVIGRDSGCDVCLPPMFVSGHHARLEFSDGRWWIQDLGSRNKTYLNGQQVPVREAIPASPGDEIVVAGIKLQLAET
jgi:FHA domain-containing protein